MRLSVLSRLFFKLTPLLVHLLWVAHASRSFHLCRFPLFFCDSFPLKVFSKYFLVKIFDFCLSGFTAVPPLMLLFFSLLMNAPPLAIALKVNLSLLRVLGSPTL